MHTRIRDCGLVEAVDGREHASRLDEFDVMQSQRGVERGRGGGEKRNRLRQLFVPLLTIGVRSWTGAWWAEGS